MTRDTLDFRSHHTAGRASPGAESEPMRASDLDGEDRVAAAVTVADLELIVPVLNEERRLPETLTYLIPFLHRQPWSTHLIVVDNGSVDATSEVVDRAVHLDLAVTVVGCRTRGKGAAVRAGVAQTTAQWVGYCDADMSTPIATIGEGVHQLQRGFDVVLASRRCTGARYLVEQPFARRMGGRLFHAATRSLVRPVRDTQCGLKLFQGPVARALFDQCELTGFAFDVEVVARAERAGLRMVEIPVQWTDCEGSTLLMLRESFGIARETVKLHRMVRRVPRASLGV